MISNVIDAIRAEFVRRGVFTETEAAKRVLFGGEHRQQHASPPRLVFRPISEEHQPIDAAGGTNPRRVAHRLVTMEVELWAESTAACEALLNHLLSTVYIVASGPRAPLKGARWADGNDELLVKGAVVFANLLFHIPVTDPPVPQVTLDSTSLDATLGTSD